MREDNYMNTLRKRGRDWKEIMLKEMSEEMSEEVPEEMLEKISENIKGGYRAEILPPEVPPVEILRGNHIDKVPILQMYGL